MGLPPCWPQPRMLCQPQGHQPSLSDSSAGLVPSSSQSCWARSRSCPDLHPSPSSGRCLMPKDGTVPMPQLPAPCWGGRIGAGCHALSQKTPMGSPLILQGPGRFRWLILVFFSLGRNPTSVKIFLCLLFGYLSILYCLFFSLHGNSSWTFFCASSGSGKTFQSCE